MDSTSHDIARRPANRPSGTKDGASYGARYRGSVDGATGTERVVRSSEPQSDALPIELRPPKSAEPTAKQLARLETRIDRSAGPEGCWIYQGRKRPGYGAIGSHRTWRVYLHRYFLEQKLGRALLPGEVARNTCDNPPCVNPAHLLPGTQRDNVHDEIARGRNSAGERRWSAKLTADQVREIVASPGGYGAIRDMAAKYGVNVSAIKKIRRGEAWNCVTGLPRIRVTPPRRERRAA